MLIRAKMGQRSAQRHARLHSDTEWKGRFLLAIGGVVVLAFFCLSTNPKASGSKDDEAPSNPSANAEPNPTLDEMMMQQTPEQRYPRAFRRPGHTLGQRGAP